MKKIMFFLFLLFSFLCFTPSVEAQVSDAKNIQISSYSDLLDWSNENGEIKADGIEVEKTCYLSTIKKKINFSMPSFTPDFIKYKKIFYFNYKILKKLKYKNNLLFNIFSRFNASPRAP